MIIRVSLSKRKKNVDKKEREISKLEEEKQALSGLQMELQMLKEARDRDRHEIQSNLETASSTASKISLERDAALAQVLDLQNQLTAAQADLSVVQSDYERAIAANSNLQNAMEAIQMEREAEQSIYEEQSIFKQEAERERHLAEIQALTEIHEKKMKDAQLDHDHTIKRVMEQIQSKELTIEHQQKENINLRRSLDEAIHRLQMSQEDIIDRTHMKNILLDWNSKRGHAKKDVLEIMASVLHFTDKEKDIMGIGLHGSGALGKVVGAVAAPLPQPVLQCDKIEGQNVREKWVNFLLAETGGDDNDDVRDKNGTEESK